MPTIAPYKPVPAADFAAAELRQRSDVLRPIISLESLTLLVGPRGIGKSFTALGIAHALASGRSFLGWTAPEPRKVLYVDGELQGAELQQRLRAFGPPPEKLELVVGGIRGNRIPRLSEGGHWKALWAPWSDNQAPHLVVLDSLSSLIGQWGKEAAGWTTARQILLNVRAIGVSVLLVHAGSSLGHARGGRHREDVFDTILSLRRPDDYQPREGLRYELHFEKARGLHGADVEPFEARMTMDAAGCAQWQRRPVGATELHEVSRLLKEGFNPLQISRQLGISKSKAYRLKSDLARTGLQTFPSQSA